MDRGAILEAALRRANAGMAKGKKQNPLADEARRLIRELASALPHDDGALLIIIKNLKHVKEDR